MGCQPLSKQQGIFDSLNYELERTSTQSYDKAIERIESLLKEVEEIRYVISTAFGAMIYESGAIVLKNPDLNSAYFGLLFQAARDGKAEVLKKINLNKNFPYIEIKDELTFSTARTQDMLNNYIDICLKYTESGKKVHQEINNSLAKYESQKKTFEQEFQSFSNSQHKNIDEARGKERRNKHKIETGLTKIDLINNKIESALIDIKLIIDRLKKEDKLIIDNQKLKSVSEGQKEEDNRVLYYIHTNGNKYEDIDDFKSVHEKIKLNRKFITLSIIPPSGILLTETPKENADPDENEHRENQEDLAEIEKKMLKEIEELDKKNKKYLEEMEKTQKKLKTKISFFDKRALPLSSWNFSLYNSFTIKEEEELYAKSIAVIFELNILAIGTKSGKILLFDHKNFGFITNLLGHSSSVNVLIYLQDGKSIISGGKDGRLFKWDTDVYSCIEIKIGNNQKPISAISKNIFNSEIYVSSGQELFVLDISTLEVKSKEKFEANITCLKWVKDAELIALGLANGVIVLHHISKGNLESFKAHSSKVSDFALITDHERNEILVSISRKENNFSVFNLNKLEKEKDIEAPFKDFNPRHLIYGNDEKTLISTYENGRFYLSNYENLDKKKYFFTSENKITCAFYCDDSNTLIFGNESGSIDYFVSR